MTPPVSINNLRVSFDGTPVLQDVSCNTRPGELTVIVGRSGSGKSTLLRAINRLNECFPGCSTTGSVNLSLNDDQLDVYAAATCPE
ncbi:MAG: ATP-binding cassette domain-containing protein, partial [Candidatus Electrothrix sp. ATG1]|nr:ATP-binding cassette domain-containing protein [Candidatus Electrothrix sp. ATG1]